MREWGHEWGQVLETRIRHSSKFVFGSLFGIVSVSNGSEDLYQLPETVTIT